MHCLYCDRPLALLKRLTGDGEFCSKEHRRIYQQQHSQLALARLLESQPKGPQKGRPPKPAEAKPAPEPVKIQEDRQPSAAEFLAEEIEPRAAAELAASESAPRFENGPPPELAELPSLAARHGDLAAGGPRTAAHLADRPKVQLADAPAQSGQPSSFMRPARKLQLEEGARSSQAKVEGRKPAGAGILFQFPSLCDAPTALRHASKARFGQPVKPSLVHTQGVVRMPAPGLRPARLLSGSGPQRIVPGKIRLGAGAPRWQPLEPVLPVHEGVKITLVLGSFVQRPIHLAGQDGLPDSFEMEFLPISFPQYAARMGCLEERSHRTDRIGFTPP